MGLREAALAAAEAALEQRHANARAVLGARLAPAEVDDLTVETTTTDLVIFTDGALHLAVRDKDEQQAVFLVQPDDTGGWIRVAAVADLPTLGTMLADSEPA